MSLLFLPPPPILSANLKRMRGGARVSSDLLEAVSPAAPGWLFQGRASLGHPGLMHLVPSPRKPLRSLLEAG